MNISILERLNPIYIKYGDSVKTKKTHNELSENILINVLVKGFTQIIDPISEKIKPKTLFVDILLSCYALFSLKYPSLLSFEKDHRENPENLKSIFHIGKIPSDTSMRERLDQLSPDALRPLYIDLHKKIERNGDFDKFIYFQGYRLLSLDGTGHFSSHTINCKNCMEKVHKNGTTTYYHQMLGAAYVHPDLREVIPLAPEPIIKQDGSTKNDCERNAAKRFFTKYREDFPDKKVIILEDGLASNAPHIRDLQKHSFQFVLGAKPKDHKYLYSQFNSMEDRLKSGKGITNGERYTYRYVNDLPLNESNQDVRVNMIEFIVFKNGKRTIFTWVTSFTITDANILILARAGRVRWKIENETFNTLKNQGYHLEHNFGHGKENLSSVMASIMMLSFLVDQIQQLSCTLFQNAWKKMGSKKRLWEKMRTHFDMIELLSMEELFRCLAYGIKIRDFKILDDL